MNYLRFLTTLLSLGDKLPVILKAIQLVIADVKALLALIVPAGTPIPAGDLQQFNVTDEEALLETQVVQAITDGANPNEPQALFDGKLLQGLWKFLSAHPGLLKWIMDWMGALTP